MSLLPSFGLSLWGLSTIPFAGPTMDGVSIHFTNEEGDDVTLRESVLQTRVQAGKSLIFLPFSGVANVACTVLNTLSLGYFSVKNGLVENNLKGRVKAITCGLLGTLATPLTLVVEAAGYVSNLFDPTINKINLLAIHMWTGFIAVNKEHFD